MIHAPVQRVPSRRLPLQWRFALWSGGLLLLGSLILVFVIDLTAPALQPRTSTVIVSRSTPWDRTSQAPPAARRDPAPPLTFQQVRTASLLGLGVVILLGSLGAYWLAGSALRPVRAVSQAAQRISATSLDTRLALDGPNDELRDLALVFDDMLDRLELAFKQQGRFVADAAHELRTPLATLRSAFELADALPELPADQRRALTATIERQLTRLERLIADLLLLAQGDLPIPKDEVLLGPLLEEVVSQLQRRAAEQGITLVGPTGALEVAVCGDSLLLARVFGNLIENGLQYTPRGGTVSVAVITTEQWVSIVVADTGIGIPPDQQERIFERFYRVDHSRARPEGGAGLGLAIASDVVRRHGGRIGVSSSPDQGSWFTVDLPRA